MRRWMLALCVWVAAMSASCAWQFEATTTTQVAFYTHPDGASIFQLDDKGREEYLGTSGRTLSLRVPTQGNSPVTFKIQLYGYHQESVQLRAAQLRDSGGFLRLPSDGNLELTPLTPWAPAALWIARNSAVALAVAATGASLILGLVLYRRRLERRQVNPLDTLIPTDARSDPNVSRRVGRYILLRQLGKGGAATVYAAVRDDDPQGRDPVAIKLMHQSAMTGASRERFIREVNICKSFNHPNLVSLLDWGDGDIFYLVMELIEGHPLRRYIPPGGMDLGQAFEVLQGVFSGLSYAHQRGIVHCDLKPENIMITTRSQVRVMDFGIATGQSYNRLTSTRDVLGTPGYMAPEQLDGVRNDPRVDQYALGNIIFEMLAGESVFEATDPMALITMHLARPPRDLSSLRPDLPPGLSDVVRRMLAKTPDERYVSLEEAWAELTHAARFDTTSLQQRTMRIPDWAQVTPDAEMTVQADYDPGS